MVGKWNIAMRGKVQVWQMSKSSEYERFIIKGSQLNGSKVHSKGPIRNFISNIHLKKSSNNCFHKSDL